jgi:hypothetical protein
MSKINITQLKQLVSDSISNEVYKTSEFINIIAENVVKRLDEIGPRTAAMAIRAHKNSYNNNSNFKNQFRDRNLILQQAMESFERHIKDQYLYLPTADGKERVYLRPTTLDKDTIVLKLDTRNTTIGYFSYGYVPENNEVIFKHRLEGKNINDFNRLEMRKLFNIVSEFMINANKGETPPRKPEESDYF